MECVQLAHDHNTFFCQDTGRAIMAHPGGGWACFEGEMSKHRVNLRQTGYTDVYSQADSWLWGRETSGINSVPIGKLQCELSLTIASDG
jgi:hypothetical protein